MKHDDRENNPYAYFEDTLDFQGHTRISELGDEDDTEPRTPFEIRCLWKKWPLTRPAKVIVTKAELTVEAKGLTEPVVIPRSQTAEVLKVRQDGLKFSKSYYPLRKLLFDRKLYGENKEKQILSIIRLTVWMEPEGTPEEMYRRVFDRIKTHSIRMTGFYLYALLLMFFFLLYLLVFSGSELHFLMNPSDWWFAVTAILLGMVSTSLLIIGRSRASLKITSPASGGVFCSMVLLIFFYESLSSSGFFFFYTLFLSLGTFIEFLLLPRKIRRLENRFKLENEVDFTQ